MEKYMNGGIMKEITVYFRKEQDKIELLSYLSDYIDLDLYDMKSYDDSFYFELREDILRENIVAFLEELNSFGIFEEEEFLEKITCVKENLKIKGQCVLENCDEIFKDRYRMMDDFSIYDERFVMDILYYAFYFDGPFSEGEFHHLLKYLHSVNQKALKNKLRGGICFGLN